VIRAHAEALAAFLVALGLRVYDTEAGRKVDGTTEAPTFPYVILTVSSPVRDTDRMVQARERHELDVTVGEHGLNPASTRWAAERVSALAGATLTVAGWVAHVDSVVSTPLRPDRDNPEQVVFSGADGFTVTSFPA
jgi:hypothetical protein